MGITAIMSTYNEMNFLPLKIQWCRSNNISLYVCDNMSTDGTWELLQKENISSHQYSTDDMFSETLVQKEIKATLERLKPDWVLYMGCDMFFDIPKDYNDYDFITFYYYSFKYAGEERTLPFNPFITHKWAHACGSINFLFRWSEKVKFNADEIVIPGKGMHNETLALNYGDIKSIEEREETKKRKQKAWDHGDPVAWGTHYLHGSARNWLWDKDSLRDMSQTSHWETIQRIAKEAGVI